MLIHTKLIRIKLLLFCVILISNITANASETAILFFDFNNSFTEVKAAKKAAKMRGEKIFVYPTKDSEKPFDMDQIKKVLNNLNNEKIQISSIVFSGHHTYGSGYYGEFGEMQPEEFRKELAKFPNIRNSIRSIFGAGCHTMTETQAQRWINYFGNLESCMGYMDIGPGNLTSSAGQNIYDFLVKEEQISNLNSSDRIFSSSAAILTYPKATSSALWTKKNQSFCDAYGSSAILKNCDLIESLVRKSYLTLRSRILGSSISESPRNLEIFGTLQNDSSLIKLSSGQYKTKNSLSVQELENDTMELRNQLLSSCPNSEVANLITYQDIQDLKDSRDVLRNHSLYFSSTIASLKALGINYPGKYSDIDDYESFYKKAELLLKDRRIKAEKNAQTLKESWGGFWNSVSDDHQSKVKAELDKVSKAKVLETVVKFMKKQVIDGECVTEDWTKNYNGKPSQHLFTKMRSNPNYCKQ